MQSTGRASAKPQRQRESSASQSGEIRPASGRLIPLMFGGWPRSRCPFQTTVRVPPVPRTWGPGRPRGKRACGASACLAESSGA